MVPIPFQQTICNIKNDMLKVGIMFANGCLMKIRQLETIRKRPITSLIRKRQIIMKLPETTEARR